MKRVLIILLYFVPVASFCMKRCDSTWLDERYRKVRKQIKEKEKSNETKYEIVNSRKKYKDKK